MDLADKIIANNSGGEFRYGAVDEYGFPLRYSKGLDYTVARIIVRNPGLCINPLDERIYDLGAQGKEPLEENNKTVMLLSGFDSPFARSFKYALVFDRLRSLLPEADMESIEVCDGLVFDGEKKELRKVLTRRQEEDCYQALTAIKNLEIRRKRNEN